MITGNSLILTDEGPIPIKDLGKEDLVMGVSPPINGENVVFTKEKIQTLDISIREVLQFETFSENTIEVTKDQLMLCFMSNRYVFVPAEEIGYNHTLILFVPKGTMSIITSIEGIKKETYTQIDSIDFINLSKDPVLLPPTKVYALRGRGNYVANGFVLA